MGKSNGPNLCVEAALQSLWIERGRRGAGCSDRGHCGRAGQLPTHNKHGHAVRSSRRQNSDLSTCKASYHILVKFDIFVYIIF